MFYSKTLPKGGTGRREKSTIAPTTAGERLTLGFFKRLVTSQDEQAFVDGCRELALGDSDVALKHLQQATHLADGATCQRIVKMTAGVTNQSAAHAALMLYKARALRQLGLFTAARDTLTAALRRKKDRPDDLLHALCYERALVYERLG